MIRKYWTTEEETYIRNNLHKETPKELAIRFNVSYLKIIDKIHKMRLNSKRARGEIWSFEEDKLLAEHFEYAPKSYIMDLFKNRTWTGILQRGIKTLKLNRLSQDKVYVNYQFFSEYNELSSYIAGFIMADGHIHLGLDNYLQIEISQRDEELLTKIKNVMDFRGKFYYGYHPNGKGKTVTPTWKIQAKNVKLIKDLNERFQIPLKDKSYVADFPTIIPKEFKRHFIRGLIDGDGWVTYSAKDRRFVIGLCGTYNIVSKTKDNLIEDCSSNSVRQDSENCYKFAITGKKAIKIADWLYKDANIFLERKYNKYLEAKGLLSPLS